MNRPEYRAAYEIANSDEDLTLVDTSHLFGYGLPEFKPTNVTLRMVAKEMRYHAKQLNGEWNGEALEEFIKIARVKFLILELVPEEV